MNTSSFLRHHPNVMMTKAKTSGNYVNSILAKTESKRLGFDEAIMLDPSGLVAEATGANIFMIRDNRIFTPPLGSILEGITRDTIMHLAKELKLIVEEFPISRDQLYTADEVFVCGTAAEVVPVREIDFRKIGLGIKGPITQKIQKLYSNVTMGQHKLSGQWLTPTI
jgi:branched-chain amino acid aminotransferase